MKGKLFACKKAADRLTCRLDRLLYYLAYSVLRVSRITFTRIWPGYSSSRSMRLAIYLAITLVPSSVTSSGLTMMRISRPDWMAKDFSTPAKSLAMASSFSRRLM